MLIISVAVYIVSTAVSCANHIEYFSATMICLVLNIQARGATVTVAILNKSRKALENSIKGSIFGFQDKILGLATA